MSSIRIFILGSLAQQGPMHGHALVRLAEDEHIDQWTDFAASAIYGALKRLASEKLIIEERVEKIGNYPERQVYRLSESGQAALRVLGFQGLSKVVLKPDPFDLVFSRFYSDQLDELPSIIQERLLLLRARLNAHVSKLNRIRSDISIAETWMVDHHTFRLRAEIDWHEGLLNALPDIVEDERARRNRTS